MDRLTIEEVAEMRALCSPLNAQYYKVISQLYDTMREVRTVEQVENQAHQRYESTIQKLQHESAYWQKCYEGSTNQLVSIELLKPPSPIIISNKDSDNG